MTTDSYLIEMRLLATTLTTGTLLPDLDASDFNYPDHRTLYGNMMRCHEDMGGVALDIFADWLQTAVGVDLRGWLDALSRESSSKPDLMPAYADKLRQINASGELRKVLDRMPELKSDDPEMLKVEAIRALESIATSAPMRKVRGIKDVMRETIKNIEDRYHAKGLPGVPSGLSKLDDLTGGFHRSDLVILAARPAVGKTALMLNMALSAARIGKRVGLFSCEQPADQVVQRLISLDGRVPAWHLRNPKLISNDSLGDMTWKFIAASSTRLIGMPIFINDDSAPNVERLLSYVRGMDVDIVFVDYVQRLKAPKTTSIYERVSAVAQALKEVARECSVPVVALAQINRAGASGARMEHLKGSGDIEQEADVVMILERKEDDDRLATLTIDKNRHGPTGLLNLVFNPSLMEFLEQDTQHDDAY